MRKLCERQTALDCWPLRPGTKSSQMAAVSKCTARHPRLLSTGADVRDRNRVDRRHGPNLFNYRSIHTNDSSLTAQCEEKQISIVKSRHERAILLAVHGSLVPRPPPQSWAFCCLSLCISGCHCNQGAYCCRLLAATDSTCGVLVA